MPRILVAGAHRSSGKTTVALGLCAALREGGRIVQAFKKGPDYIDPMWLHQASGRPCYNLDPYLMPMASVKRLFTEKVRGAGIAVVEGNQSLFDGMALDGRDSNAAVAVALRLPVVLVIDVRGVNRGIAPLLLGYRAFEPKLQVAGVILNRVGGARHEEKLRAVIAHYTDIPVLGAVHEDARIGLVERHLGLMPANEVEGAAAQVERIAAQIAAQVDVGAVLRAACAAGPLSPGVRAGGADADVGETRPVRVGVAMDRAFGFYYADDLDALRQAGAQIVPFDTLRDAALPPVDAVVIGGGFPESCAAELEANTSMRASLAAAVRADVPIHAECGGLMYMARSLTVDGRRHAMVGAIEGDVHMQRRPVGKGYVELAPTGCAPYSLERGAGTIRAHEFHYSRIEDLPRDSVFAYRMVRGHGIDGQRDGIVVRNLLASYSHLRSMAGTDWARRFVSYAGQCRLDPGGRRAPASCGSCAASRTC